MNTDETIADIIAEMRNEAGKLEASSYRPHQFLRERIAELRREADRLEAAHKREVQDALDTGAYVEASRRAKQSGNTAKLREAVDYCRDEVADLIHDIGGYEEDMERRMKELVSKCNAALAAPPRNCDVGSVAEQKERFKDFCKEGKLSRIDLGAYCAYDCPCRDSYDCKLEWAQMPYEEGGAK